MRNGGIHHYEKKRPSPRGGVIRIIKAFKTAGSNDRREQEDERSPVEAPFSHGIGIREHRRLG